MLIAHCMREDLLYLMPVLVRILVIGSSFKTGVEIFKLLGPFLAWSTDTCDCCIAVAGCGRDTIDLL